MLILFYLTFVITSLGEERACHFADCLFVDPYFVYSRFSALYPRAGGGLRLLIVALQGDLSQWYFGVKSEDIIIIYVIQ